VPINGAVLAQGCCRRDAFKKKGGTVAISESALPKGDPAALPKGDPADNRL
jgi:hypothetical protein